MPSGQDRQPDRHKCHVCPAVTSSWAAGGRRPYTVGYAISIRLHSWKPCKRCGESGKHRGAACQ